VQAGVPGWVDVVERLQPVRIRGAVGGLSHTAKPARQVAPSFAQVRSVSPSFAVNLVAIAQ